MQTNILVKFTLTPTILVSSIFVNNIITTIYRYCKIVLRCQPLIFCAFQRSASWSPNWWKWTGSKCHWKKNYIEPFWNSHFKHC